ncbi:MAG TPA: hypothetical protein VH092_23525 [Urbifossiella sp.]|nr:hypothetical protein [Urbifossiella sp.]
MIAVELRKAGLHVALNDGRSDDDLAALAGARERCAGKFREKYGYATEKRELDAFSRPLQVA